MSTYCKAIIQSDIYTFREVLWRRLNSCHPLKGVRAKSVWALEFRAETKGVLNLEQKHGVCVFKCDRVCSRVPRKLPSVVATRRTCKRTRLLSENLMGASAGRFDSCKCAGVTSFGDTSSEALSRLTRGNCSHVRQRAVDPTETCRDANLNDRAAEKSQTVFTFL